MDRNYENEQPPLWDAEALAKAVGGERSGKYFTASSVGIDSRKVTPGMLFVAIRGDRVDGHDFVREALVAGASGVLVHRMPAGLTKDAPVILVPDTSKALVQMAIHARARTRARIIAVTGSVGKTGAKEAIRAALAQGGSVYATSGNLNNHIGLPLSLANLPEFADFGVFELGMNHAGELSYLTSIARPDIAVITNVEAVHLEFFPHIDAIADAKAEIVEGIQPGGTLILNRDSRFYDRLLAKAKAADVAHIVTFGAHAQADCRLVDYRLNGLESEIEAVISGTPVAYRLGTIGRHWALTSLAALAATTAAGADLADTAAALAHFREPDGRGALVRVTAGKGAAIVIDDCYNASPSSVDAGIVKLAELHAGLGGRGRKIAVLGDMLELGVAAPSLHRQLEAILQDRNIDLLFTAGPLMRHLYDAVPEAMRGAHAADAASLASLVRQALADGDVILVKGSRGSRMDRVRDRLKDEKGTPHAV